ncbi:MAG: RluA family pseudouridine synthase [Patescibacteria group bacterium]
MLHVSILYEDKDVLVINKPAGLVVHADGRTTEPTLVDWILEHYPKIKEVGEPLKVDSRFKIQDSGEGKAQGVPDSIPESKILNPESVIYRPGIVHRIDRDTSGALVIAKNQKTFLFLKQQFQDREVEKSYRAFVYGVVKADEGVIDRPISRSRKDFRMWSAQRGGKGAEREAVTEYKVLARIPVAAGKIGGDSEGFSFLELKPKTGRTHQIRVHLKAINHPVVCDTLYAPKREAAFGFTRLALHAFSIKFILPKGKQVSVEAPYPKDFINALEQIGLALKSA